MSDIRPGLLRRIGPLDYLLLFIPIAAALAVAGAGGLYVFFAAAIAIVPLAAWLGKGTEHLATRIGEGLGGLVNATLGNAAELIIALVALKEGQVDVVKYSIVGSILGNLLLVFGGAMLAGGIGRSRQTFDRTAAGTGVSLMVVSVVALVIAGVVHNEALRRVAGDPEAIHGIETHFAVGTSIVLLITYALSLLFALKTHRRHYTATLEEEAERGSSGHRVRPGAEGSWSLGRSIAVLVASLLFISWMSELLVTRIESVAEHLGLTRSFVGIFLLAIIGNAAEHSAAVQVAVKDRMDLAMGVAIGSCLEIALLVAPALVLVSFLFPRRMDFAFEPLPVIAVALATFLFATVASDGESNWLEGVLFLAVYAILAIGFFFLP